MLGPERKSHILSKKKRKSPLITKADTLLSLPFLPYSDPVHKVSIISAGAPPATL